MGDKRQRARVQGSWAKPVPKPARPPADGQLVTGSWNSGPNKFEFHQPAEPIRVIPEEKTIEEAGVHEISQGPTGVSRLRLFPRFLPVDEADWIFAALLAELPWSQKTNYGTMGAAYEEPRLTCWYGELPYTYSRSTMQANPQWHPVLTTLRQAIECETSHTFNSLLCNLYRDGKDSIAWHSDDEPSLGPHPTIASLSLGDTRVFSLRKKPPPEESDDYTYVEKLRIPLTHGTLLIMDGCVQDDWQLIEGSFVKYFTLPGNFHQHQVAKEYHDRGPRINLTFRTIYPEHPSHQ